MEYILISVPAPQHDTTEFTRQVNEKLNEGYELVGSPGAVSDKTHSSTMIIYYFQAMVKNTNAKS